MKIDRLLGITIHLLNRDKVCARTLAERFEVSQRTIQRDIESLNLAGIPVSSSAGTNGGYEIIDSFKLNKSITNTEDYLFIVTALKGLCSAYNNQKLEATIDKVLLTSFHSTDLKQKIFLDFNVLREGNNTDKYLKFLENSIAEEKSICFDYTNADSAITHRLIEPLAITYKWYSWYLLGYCTNRCDYCLFKLSRIENLEKTQKNFTKAHKSPDILLLNQEKQDNRQYYDIKLLCKKKVKIQVLEYLKGKIINEYDNGDFLLAIHVPKNERMWFSVLLGFGNNITVIEPDELKNSLKEKAIEILKLYHE